MKMLMISTVPLLPVNAGHRARIHALYNAAVSLGHEVFFLHIEREQGDPNLMRAALGSRYLSLPWHEPPACVEFRRSIGPSGSRHEAWRRGEVAMPLDLWYDNTSEPDIIRIQQEHHFDVVVVEYVFLSKALTLFDDSTIKILDTHDRFGDRHKLLVSHGIQPDFFYTSTEEETRGLERAGAVLAIQENEARYFRSLSSRYDVECVSHFIPETFGPTPEGIGSSFRCAYCGSDNSSNVASMSSFIADTWPEIVKAVPCASLHIAGRISQRLPTDIPNVFLSGHVADLAAFYGNSDLVLNPTLMGTGVKIKSLEALGFGRALLSTPQGAIGLETIHNCCGLIAPPAEFHHIVRRLFGSREALTELHRNTAPFVRDWNNRQMSTLKTILSADRQARSTR